MSEEIVFPRSVGDEIALVGDGRARAVVQAYADATLEFIRQCAAHPGASQVEINELKRPVREALDALEPFVGMADVDEAVLAVAFAEMDLC